MLLFRIASDLSKTVTSLQNGEMSTRELYEWKYIYSLRDKEAKKRERQQRAKKHKKLIAPAEQKDTKDTKIWQ